MKIGILGTAEIAFRRFLPALRKCEGFSYAGVASRTPAKGQAFQERFGGAVYDGYDALLDDESIDAVYAPLPPALHFEWGKKALERGKRLMLEKPFTTSFAETAALVDLAKEKGLAVHENYMFLYHSQLARIKELIASGELGELRLIRVSFGFPMRAAEDFRYKKALGGGALLDCGGYPLRLARELLGESARITQSRLVRPRGYEVDLYGNAVLENDAGLCAQVAFGMDNAYQCQLEVWGSAATLIAPRIFTAPPDFKPRIILRAPSGKSVVDQEADDQFLNSIRVFERCFSDEAFRDERYADIVRQGRMVDELMRGS